VVVVVELKRLAVLEGVGVKPRVSQMGLCLLACPTYLAENARSSLLLISNPRELNEQCRMEKDLQKMRIDDKMLD